MSILLPLGMGCPRATFSSWDTSDMYSESKTHPRDSVRLIHKELYVVCILFEIDKIRVALARNAFYITHRSYYPRRRQLEYWWLNFSSDNPSSSIRLWLNPAMFAKSDYGSTDL